MKLSLWSVFLSILLNSAQAVGGQQEIFPLIEGETLSGKDVSLPKEFHDKPAWMIIGFSKDSQKATSGCAEKLDAVFKNQGYSIAILQGAPFFIKGTIKNSIRSSVPESRRDRFFVLSEGRDELQSLAGYDEKAKDDAYILGVRFKSAQEYLPVFKNHGTCDPSHLSIVTKSIQSLMGSSTP